MASLPFVRRSSSGFRKLFGNGNSSTSSSSLCSSSLFERGFEEGLVRTPSSTATAPRDVSLSSSPASSKLQQRPSAVAAAAAAAASWKDDANYLRGGKDRSTSSSATTLAASSSSSLLSSPSFAQQQRKEQKWLSASFLPSPSSGPPKSNGFLCPPLLSHLSTLSSSLPSSAHFSSHHQHRLLSSVATGEGAAADTTATTGNVETYHAGLKWTEFTSSLEVVRDSQVIPIFRVLNYEGELQGGWENPFSNEQTVEMMKYMVRLSVWDDMLYNVQRQGRISFYIQNQGEEAAQTGIAAALSVDDHLFCQYRELGVLMWRGFTLEDALNQCLSNKNEEGKGRQMPISYTKKNLNIQTICTPLTTQVPHAAGAGYAFRNAGEKRCAVTFFGEGAASEGDFHGAMNFAATLKSQTIFACRNNGYAISTPVCDQYAGDGIAIRALAYGMPTIRVDGNDLFAVFLAAQRSRQICVEESKPVCVELMTYRMGHHSTSDDSSQYRPDGELNAWTQSGVHPIARLRNFLSQLGLWTEEEEAEVRKEAKKTMLGLLKRCEKIQKFPIIPGLFEDVYREMPPHLKEQAEGLRSYLERNGENYDLSKYATSL